MAIQKGGRSDRLFSVAIWGDWGTAAGLKLTSLISRKKTHRCVWPMRLSSTGHPCSDPLLFPPISPFKRGATPLPASSPPCKVIVRGLSLNLSGIEKQRLLLLAVPVLMLI